MNDLIVVLVVESIPIGALLGGASDRAFRRRSRFWLRFTGVVIAIVLPGLVAVVAPVSEQTAEIVILLGLAWGVLLLVPSWSVLFDRSGPDPGPADDDDDGPGPDHGRPTPHLPAGGIPLPDAEASSGRIRDHASPSRARRARRSGREPQRSPARHRT